MMGLVDYPCISQLDGWGWFGGLQSTGASSNGRRVLGRWAPPWTAGDGVGTLRRCIWFVRIFARRVFLSTEAI